MNFLTFSYFVELAKELNFSKTAHKLHMSQQTLSFHISKLEEYYGCTLFVRKPQLRLTYAGEILLKEAEDILLKGQNLMDKMNLISGECIGKLRVGISSYPASVVLPMVIPAFTKKWPNIRLFFPRMSMVDRIKGLLDGKLDMAIGIYNDNDPNLHAELLYDDPLFLMISDDLLTNNFGKDKIDHLLHTLHEKIDLHSFSSCPFMTLSSSSHLGNTIDDYFSRIRFAPHVILTTQTLDVIEPLASAGIGCFICGRLRTEGILKKNKNMNAFPLDKYSSKNTEHQFKLITQKGVDLPEYANDFMTLLHEAFAQKNQSSFI